MRACITVIDVTVPLKDAIKMGWWYEEKLFAENKPMLVYNEELKKSVPENLDEWNYNINFNIYGDEEQLGFLSSPYVKCEEFLIDPDEVMYSLVGIPLFTAIYGDQLDIERMFHDLCKYPFKISETYTEISEIVISDKPNGKGSESITIR